MGVEKNHKKASKPQNRPARQKAEAPTAKDMQKLPEATPQPSFVSSASCSQLLYQDSEGSMSSQIEHTDRLHGLYRRVLGLAAITVDDASRCWHIVETIFEHGLLSFGSDSYSIALTYARLMPPRADGYIHSLYEVEMRGQTPWTFTLEAKRYLGSTTLAGFTTKTLRTQTWSANNPGARLLVALDEHERSACAAPVMRGGRLAGVIIVSSTLEDFVNIPLVPQIVGDYAHLLATGLRDKDFYPTERIKLVPMPDLCWQRQTISHFYLSRVIEYARKQCLSFPEAEQKILQELEEEFELYAANHIQELQGKECKQSR